MRQMIFDLRVLQKGGKLHQAHSARVSVSGLEDIMMSVCSFSGLGLPVCFVIIVMTRTEMAGADGLGSHISKLHSYDDDR